MSPQEQHRHPHGGRIWGVEAPLTGWGIGLRGGLRWWEVRCEKAARPRYHRLTCSTGKLEFMLKVTESHRTSPHRGGQSRLKSSNFSMTAAGGWTQD